MKIIKLWRGIKNIIIKIGKYLLAILSVFIIIKLAINNLNNRSIKVSNTKKKIKDIGKKSDKIMNTVEETHKVVDEIEKDHKEILDNEKKREDIAKKYLPDL